MLGQNRLVTKRRTAMEISVIEFSIQSNLDVQHFVTSRHFSRPVCLSSLPSAVYAHHTSDSDHTRLDCDIIK